MDRSCENALDHVMNRRFAFVTLILIAICSRTHAAESKLSPAEAKELAVEAYVYGYPLVTMEMTRRVITNVEKPEGTHAPMGSLIRLREYPNAKFRDVTAPNADTLYTTAFIDVAEE